MLTCATNFKPKYGILVLLFFLVGCVSIAPKEASRCVLEKTYLNAQSFSLTAYYRFDKPREPLNLYIEGDGASWLSRYQLADNPTPRNSLVLELANMDPRVNVAYLARPGQYTLSGMPDCDPAYWSNKRFSEEVIASMNEAINQLCQRAKADKINLIGYSGGAAIAVLIASRRNDVASLTTIAGNLDSEALNRYHHVSLLNGSLNPIDAAEKLKGLPQRHFVGAKDTIVPIFIAQSFVQRSNCSKDCCIIIIEGATHSKGWPKLWKKIRYSL